MCRAVPRDAIYRMRIKTRIKEEEQNKNKKVSGIERIKCCGLEGRSSSGAAESILSNANRLIKSTYR